MSQNLDCWIRPPVLATAAPKSLLFFAHPDDETVALGARLSQINCGAILHVTDGAPRDEQDSHHHGFATLDAYRQARACELKQALVLAHMSSVAPECFHVPDQEAAISLLTVTRKLEHQLRRLRPQAIFTHPYEGGHPDHDACAFAAHTALKLLARDGILAPVLIESTFYHLRDGGMGTGEFLPTTQPVETFSCVLTAQEQESKRGLLACFRSQQETLSLFNSNVEHFRIAPRYNFRQPPHVGPVLYDQYPWGMTSNRFCELATEAEETLQVRSDG